MFESFVVVCVRNVNYRTEVEYSYFVLLNKNILKVHKFREV